MRAVEFSTGMIHFFEFILSTIIEIIKPIYDLTRKGRKLIWGEKQVLAFDEVEKRLVKLQALHLPDNKGRFHLYSDSSKFATGSTLYQIQSGKPKLTAYVSKQLPEAVRNYSITEFEMYGLAIDIASFAHLLKRIDFDAIVDHLALTHMFKSKGEPTTTRIKRLFEVLSPYSFNLYNIKEMI